MTASKRNSFLFQVLEEIQSGKVKIEDFDVFKSIPEEIFKTATLKAMKPNHLDRQGEMAQTMVTFWENELGI